MGAHQGSCHRWGNDSCTQALCSDRPRLRLVAARMVRHTHEVSKEDAVIAPKNRVVWKTLDMLLRALLIRRAADTRSSGARLREVAGVRCRSGVSNLPDDENPTSDADTAKASMPVQRGKTRLWESDGALGRAADGTNPRCFCRGTEISAIRLQAPPATTSCVECSRRAPQRVGDLRNSDRVRSIRFRGPNFAGPAASNAGGMR